MNQIVLMGRLTADPELRETPNGVPVANFSLAVNRAYSNKETGERPVDFIDCVAWRGTATFVSKYFTKGQMAAVTGSLEMRDWTDKDGNKRRSAEVKADQVYFTGGKNDNGGSGGKKAADAPLPAELPADPDDFTDVEDGDLPF